MLESTEDELIIQYIN